MKHFADQQIAVDEGMINFILLRMPRSLEAARDVVAQISSQALRDKAEVTKPFIAKVLAGFINPGFFQS